MTNNIVCSKEFEIITSESTSDGYAFGGYIMTFNNELSGHSMMDTSSALILDPNADLNFRRDVEGNVNLPLTINHDRDLNSVVGNFVSIDRDNRGYFGRAVTSDMSLASKIKNRTIRNMSCEISSIKFETRDNVDYILGGEVNAVSLVSVPADSQANIVEFSVGDEEKITNYSDYLRNLGLSNKKANIFISKFKKFLLESKDKELLSLKEDNFKLKSQVFDLSDTVEKFKLLEGLRNGR